MSHVVTGGALDLDTIVDTAARFVTTQYASLTAAGTPITWPVTPYRGERHTLDVSTGLTDPLKAERARRDRRVALSFTVLDFRTHAERFDGQENVGLAGTASVAWLPSGEAEVRIRVDRALADFGVPRSKVHNAVHLYRAGRRLRRRLHAEAARRDTTVPRFDELAL